MLAQSALFIVKMGLEQERRGEGTKETDKGIDYRKHQGNSCTLKPLKTAEAQLGSHIKLMIMNRMGHG